MKILSFQPGSLYQNGGASRVLRRLYKDNESQIAGIGFVTSKISLQKGGISEELIQAFPIQRKWMRWKVRTLMIYVRENVFKFWTVRKIRKAASKISFDVIHIINHGPFSSALNTKSLCAEKELWVSFHDHFSTSGCSAKDAGKLWNQADRRFVISKELGLEYQRTFGKRGFEIITDGIFGEEISQPVKIDSKLPVVIYFAGLLHIDYYPLFKLLADALDSIQDFNFKLIIRGVKSIDFLNHRSFEIEYRSEFVDDEEIKAEIDSASILYLPIKFTVPNFYLYSLSTKMIGYLGASGSILYHGPKDSAACNLLNESNSAICCVSLDVKDLTESIRVLINKNYEISLNAKALAQKSFNFNDVRNRFWQKS